MKPIFIAMLKSGRQFVGGDSYYETKWEEINESIDKLFYRLPDGNTLVLHGYDSYNHVIEATKDINGENKGKMIIRNVYLMGRMGNKINSYRITLFNQTTRVFRITLKDKKGIKEIIANKKMRFVTVKSVVGDGMVEEVKINKKEVLARLLKPKDKIGIYSYTTKKIDVFEVIKNETIRQWGRYRIGDIVRREFTINDPKIKSMANNWK